MESVWQALLDWLDRQPRSVRSRPELSPLLHSLLKQAWLVATLAGDTQIRSVHLLTAMIDSPDLVCCDGLWPLLTLSGTQLNFLRPLLDEQSDERDDAPSAGSVELHA